MLGDIRVADEIYIVCGYTDMRKSIDGLCTLVKDKLHMDPENRHLYLFCGRRCDRIKVLLHESDGFILLYKRLNVSHCRYQWPRKSEDVKSLTWQQFDWLMSGLTIEQPKAIKVTKTSNAATDIKHASMIKAVFVASPPVPDLATDLEWDYDASKITVPILLIAATGDIDSNTICPLTGLQQIYNSIPDSVTKLMCRRNDGEHGDMLSYNDGYMTTFFMWQLQGDEEAGKAFIGESAEIMTNGYYQDIQRNNMEKQD